MLSKPANCKRRGHLMHSPQLWPPLFEHNKADGQLKHSANAAYAVTTSQTHKRTTFPLNTATVNWLHIKHATAELTTNMLACASSTMVSIYPITSETGIRLVPSTCQSTSISLRMRSVLLNATISSQYNTTEESIRTTFLRPQRY